MSADGVSGFSLNSHTIRGVVVNAVTDDNSDALFIQSNVGDFVAEEVKHLEQQHGLFIVRAAPGTLARHGLDETAARKRTIQVWCRQLGNINYSHISIDSGKPVVWRHQ